MLPQPEAVEVTLRAPLPDVFAAFADWPEPVFLDSSLTLAHLGRYSYIAADPLAVLTFRHGRAELRGRPGTVPGTMELPADVVGDPFEALRYVLALHRTQPRPDLPPFQGGAVGYFSYDLGRHVEVLPTAASDDLGLPELHVGLYAWVLAHDHLAERTWLVLNDLEGAPASAAALLAELAGVACSARPTFPTSRAPSPEPRVRAGFTRDGYLSAVRRAKDYIREGDIYQVCLSQRLEADLETQPWQLYRDLRRVSPVSYGAYLDFREAAVASVSPEMFLRLEGRSVETRPIKGTRPRGATPDVDAGLAEELLASEKDRAENLMIVDLLRNDLGRACRVGSVSVPHLFALESYSTVHHLVSVVRGELAASVGAVDLLRACFPGGSVTGCPKIRAMEIIEELEPTRRGPYCGAIGFLGFDGSLETSIAIRTAIAKDRRTYFQVGGAVVADSDPGAEYQETLDKAAAFLRAIGAKGVDGG